MSLRGKRRRRGRPREVVLIDARVAVVTLPDGLEQVHRQLERRQQRLAPDLLRGYLIDRRAQEVVRALGPLRLCGAEECRVRGRMRAWVRVLQLEIRDDRQLIGNRSERLERRRKSRQLAIAWRGPARDVAAHRHIDKSQSAHRRSRRLREGRHGGDHRIEQWQRHARAHTSQERPARKCLLRDNHRDFLIWKGWLFTTPRMIDEMR